MRRNGATRIVATLGPSSSQPEQIGALFQAGADVFRLNFSHGTPEDHEARVAAIRSIEERHRRPIAILADLQGPKLRVGTFAGGGVDLAPGANFRLDLTGGVGDATRASLPHPEIFAALGDGAELLLDDGRLRLRVERHGRDFAECRVLVGGRLGDRK
ncbi:MAG: pyruvate kinase, partial [Alphaproteobacteria bacterium]|nr:pyruvate kinase [Alphaproteobacteria bacterium]